MNCFPEGGKSCTPTSEEAKTVVREQGNVPSIGAFRTHGHGPVCCNCISYVTPGLACCQCGRSLTCEKSRPAHRGTDPALPHAEVWPPHNDGLRASKGPREEGVGTGSRTRNKREEERKIRVGVLKRQVVDRSCKDGSRMSHIEHQRWQLDGLKKTVRQMAELAFQDGTYQATREE